jgi:hypothetical protein
MAGMRLGFTLQFHSAGVADQLVAIWDHVVKTKGSNWELGFEGLVISAPFIGSLLCVAYRRHPAVNARLDCMLWCTTPSCILASTHMKWVL